MRGLGGGQLSSWSDRGAVGSLCGGGASARGPCLLPWDPGSFPRPEATPTTPVFFRDPGSHVIMADGRPWPLLAAQCSLHSWLPVCPRHTVSSCSPCREHSPLGLPSWRKAGLLSAESSFFHSLRLKMYLFERHKESESESKCDLLSPGSFSKSLRQPGLGQTEAGSWQFNLDSHAGGKGQLFKPMLARLRVCTGSWNGSRAKT